ncbi:MAG: succinate-semialdehyde dehydrogenase (NADP(+)) [Propionibacteriales bacterium]|nr:succinate-semialdehyde dehydrogenase (NADP(+)) [Propionibacteriales bacterium]
MSNSPEGTTITVRRPFDNQFHAEVPRTTADQARAAISRARRIQPRWAELPVARRADVIARAASLILAECDRILDVIQDESGKARISAFEEVMDSARGLRVFANKAPQALRARRRPGAIPALTKTVEHHRPVGVVSIITPWNYPFTLPATDAAQALLAGNAVVLKPDSQTPSAALLLAEIFAEAGLPADLFTVLPGAGSELGPVLVAETDFVMFTGSTATGRTLAAACAQRLIGFSGELGGKNPLLVLPDADLDAAAIGTARAAFANTGQLCISIERAYVHRSVYPEFVERLLAATASLKTGVGHSWEFDIGSLSSAAQLATVEAHVADAVAKGATVLAGGRHRGDLGPFCYEPTILAGVTPEMEVFAEETFGPVLSLYQVNSIEDAINAANDSRYGLNASIWSRHHGPETAARLRTGTVNINDGYAPAFGSHAAPMGGMKESGVGRRHGSAGLLKYTEAQTVADQRLLPIAPPPGVSNETFARVLKAGIAVMNRVLP